MNVLPFDNAETMGLLMPDLFDDVPSSPLPSPPPVIDIGETIVEVKIPPEAPAVDNSIYLLGAAALLFVFMIRR